MCVYLSFSHFYATLTVRPVCAAPNTGTRCQHGVDAGAKLKPHSTPPDLNRRLRVSRKLSGFGSSQSISPARNLTSNISRRGGYNPLFAPINCLSIASLLRGYWICRPHMTASVLPQRDQNSQTDGVWNLDGPVRNKTTSKL